MVVFEEETTATILRQVIIKDRKERLHKRLTLARVAIHPGMQQKRQCTLKASR